ncbi:MAG: hypothetical protein ABI266_00530 [Ginsengibacter sp.]
MNKADLEFNRKVQQVTLRHQLPLNTEIHYELLNNKGMTVLSKTVMNFLAVSYPEKFEVSHLSPGEYMLIVSTHSPNKVIEKISIQL